MREFEEAGGSGYTSEHNLKSELLAIPPGKLREDIATIRQAPGRAIGPDSDAAK